MNKTQDSLVVEFCEARILRDDEYKMVSAKYEPKRDALIEYMVENGINEIVLDDSERLELKWWKQDGVQVPTIWWRKDRRDASPDGFIEAIARAKQRDS